jgi:monovalent cation/proton antiporter MnhG/PhaG subunit
MTWQFIAVRLLLVFGIGVEVLCCAGILAMRSTFARIHFLGPATILGATSIAAAIVVHEALSQAGIKAILIAAALLAASPLLGHVTGRAAYLRRYGNRRVPDVEEENR